MRINRSIITNFQQLLDWSYITGKPTTISGYGIIDAISGSGTANYVPKFATSTSLGNSIINENSSAILINTTTNNGLGTLQVNGRITATSGSTTPAFIGTQLGTANWIDGTSSTWYSHIGHNSPYAGFGTVTGANIESCFAWFYNGNQANAFNVRAVNFGDDPRTAASLFSVYQNGSVAIGTSSTSTEANLFLGAKGTDEGGQLVLQKATTWTYASHIDVYQDQLRFLYGTNTASSGIRMSIDLGTGQVGIGDNPANGRLYVKPSNNEYSGYFLSPNTSGQSYGLYVQAGTNTSDSSFTVLSASGSDYMVIKGNGDVGIGNSNPGAKLHVTGNIKTDSPSGGTAQPWKLGQYNATAPSATGYVEVEVNGTLYKLLAST